MSAARSMSIAEISWTCSSSGSSSRASASLWSSSAEATSARRCRREFVQLARDVSGLHVLHLGQQRIGALTPFSPEHLDGRTTRRWSRGPGGRSVCGCRLPAAPPGRAPTRGDRTGRIETSKITEGAGWSSRSTVRSNRSSITSVSEWRRSNRRVLTTPEITTWTASMLRTRAISMKIRCRANSSTTRPLTRGARPSARRCTTTSRTLPTWSPALSRTGRLLMREMKTEVAVAEATRRLSQGPTPFAV